MAVFIPQTNYLSRRIMRWTFNATGIKTGRITGRTRKQKKGWDGSVRAKNLTVKEYARSMINKNGGQTITFNEVPSLIFWSAVPLFGLILVTVGPLAGSVMLTNPHSPETLYTIFKGPTCLLLLRIWKYSIVRIIQWFRSPLISVLPVLFCTLLFVLPQMHSLKKH